MLDFSLGFSSCPSSENSPGNTRLLRDTAQFFKPLFSCVGRPHLSLSIVPSFSADEGLWNSFISPVASTCFPLSMHIKHKTVLYEFVQLPLLFFITTQFYLHIPVIITAILLTRQYGYVFVKLFSLSICCY